MPLNSHTPEQSAETGKLYIVSTPVGNLEDITFRAVRILKQVDCIAAEDTRQTLKLLNHYEIKKKLVACHEHNEQEAARDLVEKMKQGMNLALVTDGGTPLVSDPGFRLVALAVENGLDVIPIPGACAAVAALAGAGLPTDRFLFCGFLPRKQGKLREALEAVKNVQATLVFYESPRRALKLAEETRGVLGDRQAVLARELTKIHEEFLRGSLSEIVRDLAAREEVRGECTFVVAGPGESLPMDPGALEEAIREGLARGDLSASKLAAKLAKEFGIAKKTVYAKALEIQDQDLT